MYDNDYIKCPSCGGEVISTLKKCIYCQSILDTELDKDLSSLKYKTISIYGGTYSGELLDGDPYGHGTLSLPNGIKYSGEWRDGKQNGKIRITYPNKQIYEGSCKDGAVEGYGKLIEPDGVSSEGEWKKGALNGEGIITFPNGNKYTGGFLDGLFNGQGKIIYADGRIIIGEFKNGRLSGHYEIINKNGTKITNLFKDGNIVKKESDESLKNRTIKESKNDKDLDDIKFAFDCFINGEPTLYLLKIVSDFIDGMKLFDD